MKGKTSTGFEFDFPDERIDDWEIFKLICAVDNGDASKLPMMAEAVLGVDQLKRLEEHIAHEEGKVTLTAINREINEIFSGDEKN